MSERINFAWPVTTFGKYDLDVFSTFIKDNAELLAKKKIVVFGSGIRGTQFARILKNSGYTDISFTDNNERKVGGYINEFPIISVDLLVEMRDDIVIIISAQGAVSIKKQLDELGFCEDLNYFYIENHLYENYEKNFLKKGHSDIVLMGDCGITDLSITDTELSNLGEMIQSKIGSDRMKVMAIHAMGMRAYYTIFKAHVKYVEKPKMVALMCNMEVFTGKQHMLPRSQHAKLIERLSNSIENKEKELLEYVAVTKERFENFANDYFTSSEEAMNGMSQDKNDKIVMKLNYMFKMDENNECIVYLKKFIEFCKEEGIKLLLFIPPANYEYAQKVWGERFDEKYKANVAVLQKIASEHEVPMHDFSYRLKSEQFAALTTIDETLNQVGRRIICDELSQLVEEIYEKECC